MRTPLKKTFENPEYLAKSRKFDNKCVCQICVCGKKHKCPEKGVKFEAQTTNNEFYKPHAISPQKREKVQQKPLQTHYDPLVMQSSYNTFYTPHKIGKQSPYVSKNVYEVPKGKFQGESQYKKNYTPIKTKPQRFNTSPSKQYVPNNAKFQDDTTYKRQYSPKKAAESFGNFKPSKYQPSTTPFEGQSNYKTTYKPHKIEPNRPMTANRNEYTPNKVPFDGNTRYREFYKPHKIEPKQRCPTDYLPQRPLRCSPGKQHIHYSAQQDQWE